MLAEGQTETHKHAHRNTPPLLRGRRKNKQGANLRLGAAASCICHVTRIVIAQRERGEWRYRRPYCVHSLAPCSLGGARSRLFVSARPLLPTRACPVDDPAATPSPQISRCCCCWGRDAAARNVGDPVASHPSRRCLCYFALPLCIVGRHFTRCAL